ncbi:MAG: hypothetical protein KKA79_01930 [Nanoarchaeota archaeon]|nr:hypothetical protein [Nanoarchaeota archaeon]
MNKLELLLEQEYDEPRLEYLVVGYSFGGPDNKSPDMDKISDYALGFYNQFKVETPESNPMRVEAPTPESFDINQIQDNLNTPYQSSLSEQEAGYINSLNNQYNAPSPDHGQPVQEMATPETFSPSKIIETFNEPSFGNFSYGTPAPEYVQPGLIQPSIGPLRFEPPKAEPPRIIKFDPPEKKFYQDFRKDHKIKFSGLKTMKPVYDLFKDNELPNKYNQFSKGMKLGKNAVKVIIFTNPNKEDEDFSPSFDAWKRELKLPAIKPKTIPFNNLSQKEYNRMSNNSFLPHELGHAKIEEEYGKHDPDAEIYKPELQGFNEHLADQFAFDAVKGTPQEVYTKMGRIKFEDLWATKNDNGISRAMTNYDEDLSSKESASLIPGKQATIETLGHPVPKFKYDYTLNKSLDLKYGNDPHKYTVYQNINNLSNLYQEEAIKLVDLSKRNSILSGFKAKRILSKVEKETLKFTDDL